MKRTMLLLGAFLALVLSRPADSIARYSSQLDLNAGLVAYFPFNGHANDASGNGHHASVNGAVPTTDRFGQSNAAYNFDGVDDVITVPHHNSLNFSTGDFTLACWVYFNKYPTNDCSILSKTSQYRTGQQLDDNFGWSLVIRKNGCTYVAIGAEGTGDIAEYQTPLGLNKWYSLIGLRRNNVLELYVNGELKATRGGTGVNGDNEVIVEFGARKHNTPDQRWLNGKMDEVRIYNRALAQAEIDALYDRLPSGPIPTFTDIRGSSGTAGDYQPYSEGAAFADIDLDGNMDIYLSNTTGADYLFKNEGDLHFTDVFGSSGIIPERHLCNSFGDFDNDGFLDILIAGHWDVGLRGRLYRGSGGFAFTDVSAERLPSVDLGARVTWADLNSDGWLDIVSAHRIMLSEDGSFFTDITQSTGIQQYSQPLDLLPCLADFDNDGRPELILMEFGGNIGLYRMNSDLTFTNITAPSGLPAYRTTFCDVAVGDIDNDGDIDIYIARGGGGNMLFRNDGNCIFTDITSSSGTSNYSRNCYSTGFEDVNNDGFMDIYASNYKSPNVMYLNNGDNTFSDITAQSGTGDGGAGHGIAYADIENDGDLDLYVTNSEGTRALYLNNGTANNWLQVKLIGTVSNRSAIGARIHLVSVTKSLMREAARGASFGFQNNTPVHFGLGADESVEYLEVRWPSGIVQRIDGPSIDQIITVVEPQLNEPPTACAGEDFTLESPSPEGALVQLTGSCSSDPDGDALTYTWRENGQIICGPTTASICDVTLALGCHIIELTVDDDKGGTDTDETIVNVVDTTPPTLFVSASPALLWPPNHKMVDICALVTVSDVCDPAPVVKLVSIASDEPDNGLGDGDKPNDIQRAEIGTADYNFQLRAERSGAGDGRAYTIVYEVSDASGNHAAASATVTVPHDMEKAADIEASLSILTEYTLLQNYPNPFNPETEIRFALPEPTQISLRIFTALGAEVCTLAEDHRPAGAYTVRWDGKDRDGNPVASGIYFYQLQAEGFREMKKMSLVR